MNTQHFKLKVVFLIRFLVLVSFLPPSLMAAEPLITGSETLEKITEILERAYPTRGYLGIKELASSWDGSRDPSQILAIATSLTPVPATSNARFHQGALHALFAANIASDQAKGDLLAELIPAAKDPLQCGMLYGFARSPNIGASSKLRQVLYNDLDDFELTGDPSVGRCETGIRAYNCLLSWMEDTRVVDPDQTHGMSPHCLPQFRDPQIAELKKILTDKGLIALKDEAFSKKGAVQNNTERHEIASTPTLLGALPTNKSAVQLSAPAVGVWSVSICVAVGLGVLWSLLKKRK